MERRIIPEAENRLTILYAITRLGPCTASQLLQFMVETDIMNYFTLQLGLCEMEEQGQLGHQPHPLGSLLTVTDNGQFTLGTFASRIPHSRREQIDSAAPAWRARFRLEQQTPAECTTLPGGMKCLRLRLMEGEQTLLDLLLTLPASCSYHMLGKRWENAAQKVLLSVTEHLISGSGDVSPDAPLPEGCLLMPTSSGEWRLTLACGEDNALIALTLSLPTEQLGRLCASRWFAYAPTLRRLVLDEMAKDPQY